jgi:3-hydroxymyristoyl/3-hydroxydecanoyl-(acyl carrier protein) dehydratase
VQGRRVFRLLGGTAVFHDRLPAGGETMRYEVTITRFVWRDDQLMYFFDERCYAGGRLIVEVKDGCAGLFTHEELAEPQGVIITTADRRRLEQMTTSWFKPLADTERTALSRADLEALAAGKPGTVFGAAFDQTGDGCNPSMRLPAGDMLMIDEVTGIDRRGGPRGLGRVSAVKEISPDDWYFACHFPGDPVMPGFMVLEGAAQVLQTYALSLGLHLVLPDAEFQPLPGRRVSLTLRGQVTPDVDRIRFEAEITEITLLPRPTLVGDVTVYLGDQPITVIRDFGIQVREKPGTPAGPEAGGRPRSFLGRRNAKGEPALLNELHLAHLAKGDLAVAFGPEFEVYEGRTAIRLPNGDYQFLDRIMEMRGERGAVRKGASSVMEYDSAADRWYYQDPSQAGMPNCVLLETTLQPTVVTGYLLGSTLETPGLDLCLRNLGGRATLLREVDLRGRTLRHEAELLTHQRVGDTLLQNYRYRSLVGDEVFYEGESLFGYFTAEAMAAQRGLDDGSYVPPWLARRESGGWDGEIRKVDLARHPRIPRLQVIDEAEIAVAGGEHGLGYLRGRKTIDPADWYFACHFHGDPVMPGSLGVEALYEGLQILTVELGLTGSTEDLVFGIAPGVPLGWKYRGQILPGDGEILLDVHLKRVERRDDRLVVVGDGSIWKPGLRIYEVTDIAVEVRPR